MREHASTLGLVGNEGPSLNCVGLIGGGGAYLMSDGFNLLLSLHFNLNSPNLPISMRSMTPPPKHIQIIMKLSPPMHFNLSCPSPHPPCIIVCTTCQYNVYQAECCLFQFGGESAHLSSLNPYIMEAHNKFK